LALFRKKTAEWHYTTRVRVEKAPVHQKMNIPANPNPFPSFAEGNGLDIPFSWPFGSHGCKSG
jgi:hypothetical protein